MQKATASSRRGRPPKFDEDEVVDAAVGAFFAKGLDGTTLGDIETATGIDRSTLYNSFDGKDGLYHRATERYLDQAAIGLFGPLGDADTDGLDAITDFLRRLRDGLTSSDVSPGCLIVNDMAAASDPAAAQRYRDLLETGLRSALGRAAEEGSIQADTIDARAALLSTTVIGVNLISGHTGDNAEVARLVDGAADEVARWRDNG
ncbi:MAG: TetR/AcrR family transcriptional regulator [Ilumatobacteraceae bacterium]